MWLGHWKTEKAFQHSESSVNSLRIQNFHQRDEKSEAAPVQLLGIMRRTENSQSVAHHSQLSGVERTAKPPLAGIPLSEVIRKVEVYKSH